MRCPDACGLAAVPGKRETISTIPKSLIHWVNKYLLSTYCLPFLVGPQRCYVQGLPNAYFTNCMEFGYSLCGNATITPVTGRELGRNVMKSLAEILQEDSAKEQ